MDQELKQRLLGATVITALLTIFVPMMFDDEIDEKGKTINELKIPEPPVKPQEVQIMPLPGKAEDVGTVLPVAKPGTPPVAGSINEEEGDDFKIKTREPQTTSTAPAVSTSQQSGQSVNKAVTKDAKVSPKILAEEEPVPATEEEPVLKPAKTVKPIVSPTVTTQSTVAVTPAPPVVDPALKPLKPVKPVSPSSSQPSINPQAPTTPNALTGKPVNSASPVTTATRWYLNAASFSQKPNAVALQDTLKQQGFAATIKESTGEKGVVYKVRIGPIQDKAKAQDVKNKLMQINVPTFVVADE